MLTIRYFISSTDYQVELRRNDRKSHFIGNCIPDTGEHRVVRMSPGTGIHEGGYHVHEEWTFKTFEEAVAYLSNEVPTLWDSAAGNEWA